MRIIDDRKDKVQAKWNLRNGITFWDKQSWLAEQSPSTHSSSEMVEKAALSEMEKLSKHYKQYGDLVEKRTVDECISILKKHI